MAPSNRGPVISRHVVLGVAALVVAVLLVVGLALTQPWRLLTNTVVDEGRDGQATATTVSGPSGQGPATSAPTGTPGAPGPSGAPSAEPTVVARGTFTSHEHTTTGTALVLQRPDGSRFLRLEQLDTSDGPDLVVWLSAGPVVEGRKGWFVFKDHERRELGALKGNKGNQNYDIPAGTDLGRYRSVTVWCQRFSVSFGAAPLQPV